jgi:cytochrome c-type biogenesis protein CcmH
MTWLAIAILSALVLGALMWLGLPRGQWQAAASALMLGLAGYALQANPNLADAPKAAAPTVDKDGAAMVAARNALAGGAGLPSNRYLLIADAMARQGHYADAATVLLGAIESDPKDGESWLALANALSGHADGTLTPAALYAYRKAGEAAPGNPGPPFFLGLTLARSGRFADARAAWAGLLAASPADAPWRADLQQRLTELDALMTKQEQAGR